MLVYIILHTPSRYISTKSKRKISAKTKNFDEGFNEQAKEETSKFKQAETKKHTNRRVQFSRKQRITVAHFPRLT